MTAKPAFVGLRIWAVALVATLSACTREPSAHDQTPNNMSISIASPAFREGQPIPAKYTGDGADISPPLEWSGVPPNTKTLLLICDDPDAPVGTWTHWVLFDLPASLSALAENVPATESLDNGAKQGLNDFRRLGYGGPAPPPGKPHRYFFRLSALDTDLALRAGATKEAVVRAMKGHVLAQGQLMGTYGRAR